MTGHPNYPWPGASLIACSAARQHGWASKRVEDSLLGHDGRVVRETERVVLAAGDRECGGDRREEPERVVADEVGLRVAL